MASAPPAISVITPSFNQAKYIRETIESVARQKPFFLEHIVVDGGSTDETIDVLKSFGDRISWTSGPDAGQADAVNKGFARARGDVLGWLNSDDVYLPGALEAVSRFFQERPDVDVLYGRARHIDADGRTIGTYPTEPFDRDHLVDTCFFCQPAVFFRARVFKEVGPLDVALRYSLDYEYWFRIAERFRPEYLPVFLAGSRLHAETKTLGQRRFAHKEIVHMLVRRAGRAPYSWILGWTSYDLGEWLGIDFGGEGRRDWLWAAVSRRRGGRWYLDPAAWAFLGALPLLVCWRFIRLNRRVPVFWFFSKAWKVLTRGRGPFPETVP
jgi:glycosyltransferase involved in cell wall biosynthesis